MKLLDLVTKNSSDLDRLELDLERDIYRESYYEFYKKAFAQLHPGTEYDDNWHASYICSLLQAEAIRIKEKRKREKDIIINVPFRSSKSMLVTVIWPVWCWACVDPSMKFITVSFSGNLAIEHSARSLDLIQSHWFQRLFGHIVKLKSNVQAKGHYETDQTGMRKAVGTGGQITGSGSDVIICLRGDQKILTDKGELEISKIVDEKLDVKVASFNHELDKLEYQPILNYHKNKGKKLLRIKVGMKELVCTEDHEVWVRKKGYVKAKDIVPGDYVMIRYGDKPWNHSLLKVTVVEQVEEIPDYVYNLEVDVNHNYFVNGILTHNCDDPQDPTQAASVVERENTKNFYSNVLYSRLNDPDVGVRILVQQRLNEQDATGMLMDPKNGRPNDHRHICIPGEYNEKTVSPPELKEFYIDGLFWSTRFHKQALASFKKSLGELAYAGQINQLPAPPEGNLVKRHWFTIKQANLVERNPQSEPTYFFLDTAYTEKTQNDPSGVLCCFIRKGIIYILNIAEVWKIFPELVPFVQAYVNLNDYSKSGSMIWVEPKASGKSLVQTLRMVSDLNVGEIESELVNGKDKMGRLSTVSPYIQSGRVVLVEGTWNDQFLTQVCSFPNAAHDEFVDLLCYAVDTLLIRGVGDNSLGGFL